MDEPLPDLALLEFDPSPRALIEPSVVLRRQPRIPDAAVLCFFSEVIESLAASGEARVVGELRAEHGTHPIYAVQGETRELAVVHPGVGAPLAAAFLEETIALGARTVVACGGAGAVARELVMGRIVVPTSAVRDEGTSFHYLAPSREVEADPAGVAAAQRLLEARGVNHLVAKTWTTDAIYRETPDRIARRRAEGCVTVEMEAAAFFAVARFRAITFAQLLYAGDDVSGETWEHRSWQRSPSRQLTFELALELAADLADSSPTGPSGP